MKRQKVTIFSIVGLVVLAFSTSPVLAQECPSGQVRTTIVNPAGKVIEICVPEAAIPNIGGGGDTVIPAVCPCFSQEVVQAAFDSDPVLICLSTSGTTTTTGEACTFATCFDGVPSFFEASEGPLDDKATGSCAYQFPTGGQFVVLFNNFCDSTNTGRILLTEAEADACVAILQTFE